MNTADRNETMSSKTRTLIVAAAFMALLVALGATARAAAPEGVAAGGATNNADPGNASDLGFDPADMEKAIAWTINSLDSTGCNSGDIGLSTTLSGYTGGPERFRTIVEAAGLRFMDEDAGVPGSGNGPYQWNLYSSSSGGPTTASFPLPSNTQIGVKFNFISGSGGRSIFSRRVVLNRCNSGSILSNVVACSEDSITACLLEGRFRVSVRFRGAFDNLPVDSSALRKTVTGFNSSNFETAFFYFNSPDNIEVMVKMLDQGNTNSIGQRTIAVITGSATPLRTEVTILDGWTGVSKVYTSPFNTQIGKTDFVAFVK